MDVIERNAFARFAAYCGAVDSGLEPERSDRNLLNDKFVIALWRHIELLPKAWVSRIGQGPGALKEAA
jgi:hypothetical protein